jgi:hypothetical protein
MSHQQAKPTQPNTEEGKVLNRRSVLRVAVATAPLIATLPSGAALAKSSNLVTGTTPAGAIDAQGRTLCLDVTSGTGNYSNGVLDLGVPARGKLTAIKDRRYRVDDKYTATQISESQMCYQGGTYYYWNSGWHQAQVPKGMLVSATALSSFAGSIFTTEV